MKKHLLSLLAASALFAGAPAWAQNLTMSTYLGASVGAAAWNVDCAGTTECKKNPVSFRVYGGYNFEPQIALELTYASLGTVKLKSTTASADITGNSFDVSAVYKFGGLTTGLGGFLKGGLAYARTTGVGSKNSFSPLLGAGLVYHFNPNLAVRAEVDTQRVEVNNGGKGNVTSLSLGGQASF